MPQAPGDPPSYSEVGPVEEAGGYKRLFRDQHGPDEQNEKARPGSRQEKNPGSHNQDTPANGQDFLVKRAWASLLPLLEVFFETLARRRFNEMTPALFKLIEHGQKFRISVKEWEERGFDTLLLESVRSVLQALRSPFDAEKRELSNEGRSVVGRGENTGAWRC